MKQEALFRFHGALNDFLSSSEKNAAIVYSFSKPSSIKDIIEALGIPHPEVCRITVNDADVNFRYWVKNGDEIEVYPYQEPVIYAESDMRFILDVHLGALAKNLRILGIDALYQNDYTEKQIVKIATFENRILLTRDRALLKHASVQFGYCLRSDKPPEQLMELIRRFDLKHRFKPFTRCLECNGIITPVNKGLVADQVPEKSRQFYNEFFQCEDCKRVYWKGSHFKRMKAFVNSIE